ncbi:MAG: hypothetical protein Q4A46_09840, partial [Clostridia bacterium]|nr:hypothetical protein [Clostridia bacterium]
MQKINKKYVWLIAPIITIIWILVLYYIKGIYPFGSGTIIDHDLFAGDVPALFYKYDVLHGGNFFYDFTTAGGFGRNSLFEILDFT